jgi:ParB family chromosome partitioning protein
MAKIRRGLGRGLDALFQDNAISGSEEKNAVLSLRIGQVEPNPDQPRKTFDQESLQELADSIAVHGVIQPLLVQQLDNGQYGIIAGERRWRAARMAGLTEVPAILREYTRQAAMEVAMVENLQREDLSPIEEAQGYQLLMDAHELTQEEVARKVGKARSTVTNSLRLLSLPASVQIALEEGQLSPGHARALLSLGEGTHMEQMAEAVVRRGLSVRETEAAVRKAKQTRSRTGPGGKAPQKPAMVDFSQYERRMESWLGQKVRIVHGKRKGKIEIEYSGNEAFDALLDKLTGKG